MVEIDQSAANLEGADRGMVFVFDPDFSAESLAEQGPSILRCGRKNGVNGSGGGFDLVQGELHDDSPRFPRR